VYLTGHKQRHHAVSQHSPAAAAAAAAGQASMAPSPGLLSDTCCTRTYLWFWCLRMVPYWDCLPPADTSMPTLLLHPASTRTPHLLPSHTLYLTSNTHPTTGLTPLPTPPDTPPVTHHSSPSTWTRSSRSARPRRARSAPAAPSWTPSSTATTPHTPASEAVPDPAQHSPRGVLGGGAAPLI
jgi:hypothetical protein